MSGSSQLRALLSSSGRSASPAPRAGAGTPPPDTANTRGHNGDMGIGQRYMQIHREHMHVFVIKVGEM